MAETTTKRGRGRPKKEVLLRQVSVGIYYQSPNYFRPIQVAQFNVSEKTADFDHTIINSDPNLFIDRIHEEDSVGKLYLDYKDSIKTIRKFRSYKVASIANSKRFPDLSGFFLKVLNLKKIFLSDLFDSKCCHYFVTGGKMKVHIKDNNKNLSQEIKEGDCLWLSAFTYHGFTGDGSLLKISDGQNINYLEKEDL